MKSIVAADIGGTNARFCRAELDDSGVPKLGVVRKYKVADYPTFQSCWAAFVGDEETHLPRAASFALATALGGETIKLTNSSWVIRPDLLQAELGLDALCLVNDFEAVGHAVSRLPPANLQLLFGPDAPFPKDGAVTILGPGTGLGVGMIAYENGVPHVMATEGGHLDYAPLDSLEDRIVEHLRAEFLRVSTERIVSGPGLNNLYKALATIGGHRIDMMTDATLWTAALEGTDSFARTALQRFCLSYGSVAGDLALAHGPHCVVLAGGITQRMKTFLLESGFYDRFTAKGRFKGLMERMPVRLAVHDDIGLFGAAASFAGRA